MSNQADIFEDIYRQFEDRFRGSHDEIKRRLEVYFPLLNSAALDLKGACVAFDLGCGRGEWLELLSEQGWRGIGIDSNAGMATVARQRGLTVHEVDVLEFLRAQPSNSAGLVSAFHLVEHVPIQYLTNLLRECHRVLVDTGLLILETPNPENLTVGTWSFHLDPTHNKPLPPLLLQFLVQNSGFDDAAIIRLNGRDPRPQAGPLEQAAGILFNAGMDYSVVAQKRSADWNLAESKMDLFACTVSQSNPADTGRIIDVVRHADLRTVNLEERSVSIERSLADLRADIERSFTELKVVEADLRGRLSVLSETVDAVYTSSSWRITAPIRSTKRILDWFLKRLPILFQKKLHRGLVSALRAVKRSPHWERRIRRLINHVPWLETRLRILSRNGDVSDPHEIDWRLSPDPASLRAWHTLLRTGPNEPSN